MEYKIIKSDCFFLVDVLVKRNSDNRFKLSDVDVIPVFIDRDGIKDENGKRRVVANDLRQNDLLEPNRVGDFPGLRFAQTSEETTTDGTKRYFGLDLEKLSYDEKDIEFELARNQRGFKSLFSINEEKLLKAGKTEMHFLACYGDIAFADYLRTIAHDNKEYKEIPILLKYPSNQNLVWGMVEPNGDYKQRGAIIVAEGAKAILFEHFSIEQAQKDLKENLAEQAFGESAEKSMMV